MIHLVLTTILLLVVAPALAQPVQITIAIVSEMTVSRP